MSWLIPRTISSGPLSAQHVKPWSRRAAEDHTRQLRTVNWGYNSVKMLPRLVSLSFCCDIEFRIGCKKHERMAPFCLISMVQAAGCGDVIMWHTLGPLVPITHNLCDYIHLIWPLCHFFGMGSWMWSIQMCSFSVILPCEHGQKSLRNVFNTLLNLCHGKLSQYFARGCNKVALLASACKWGSEHVLPLQKKCLLIFYLWSHCPHDS